MELMRTMINSMAMMNPMSRLVMRGEERGEERREERREERARLLAEIILTGEEPAALTRKRDTVPFGMAMVLGSSPLAVVSARARRMRRSVVPGRLARQACPLARSLGR